MSKRWGSIALVLTYGLAIGAFAPQARSQPMPHAMPSADVAASRLLEFARASPASDESGVAQPFTDKVRSDWHYTPRRRVGLPLKDMSEAQRDATTALLRSALTDSGLEKVRAVMELEIVLKEIETFGLSRIPENYAVAIYGTPTANEAWGWRIEGHHLSLHFSLLGGRYVSTLPQFFGANPAVVPQRKGDDTSKGLRKGTRVLGVEEDQARALLESFDAGQRKQAVIDARTYGDLVSRNATRATPLQAAGLMYSEMTATQQAQLLRLIVSFAEHLRPALIEQRLARVRAGAMDSIRFGWAGSTTRNEPYYFRIQGPQFLIEFDNSGGNHIHSVWRDFDGDWGRDALAEHYRTSDGSRHPHGKP